MMRTRPVLHRFAPATLAGLALVAPFAVGPAAAAASSSSVAAAAASSSSVAAAAASSSSVATTAASSSSVATAAPTCRGAVVQRVAVPTLPRGGARFCIAVGGVVRVESLGPGMLRATPRSRIECAYEAGVHQCRLTRTGRVKLTVLEGDKRTISVTVAKASRPPKPSPACRKRSAVLRLDPVNDQLAWWAECMKVGATVRVTNLGRSGLQVTPRRAVSCRYHARVHTCRLRSAATLTFVTRTRQETRRVTVVAIR